MKNSGGNRELKYSTTDIYTRFVVSDGVLRCVKVSRAAPVAIRVACARIIKGQARNWNVFQLEIVARWPEVVADPLFYSTRERTTTVNRRLVWLASGHYLLRAAYLNFMSLNRGINHCDFVSVSLSLSFSHFYLFLFRGSKINSLLEEHLPCFKPPVATWNVAATTEERVGF